jgi:hypothetical protein
MTRTHSPRDRRGFALALSLVAIVVIGAMVAGGYLAGVQEFRLGRNSLVQQRALAATELGLDTTYALWNKTWNSTKTGTTTVLAYTATDNSWVDTVRITKLNQLSFLVVSEGYAGSQASQIGARRRAAMLIRLNMPKVNQIGALTTRGNVVISGSTMINGTDTLLAGWDCPTLAPPVAGVAVPSLSNLNWGGKCPKGSCVIGSPSVSITAAAGDTNTYFTYGSLTWAMLVAQADKMASGTLTHVRPSTIGSPTGPCNTIDNLNWGDPMRAAPSGGCEGYFPVIYAPGDVTINGDYGQGILLVGGNLSIQGGFTYYGQIIARGTVKLTGSDNHVYGGILAASVVDSTDASKLSGNSGIHYSRCALNTVFTTMSLGRRAPQRSWIELF